MRSAAFCLLAILLGVGGRALAAPAAADATIANYHADPARSGDYVAPGLSWQAAQSLQRDMKFDGKVHGKVYAQPLYWHPDPQKPGLVIVATESDEVDALDADTGRAVWRRKLATPVSGPSLPCGDINPLGITGTPVIDTKTGTLYLDAMTDQGGTPAHLVFALRLADGAVLPGWPVDVRQALRTRGIGFDPGVQNQRSALALLNDRVFVAFGGLAGDCGAYHGTVLGLPVDRKQAVSAWTTRGAKGGIWAPGGISVDGGKLFFATGNTEDAQSWADGEGIFRKGPDLADTDNPRDFFVPSNWKSLDEADLDMSGTNPLPLEPGGAPRLLALGKDGDAYLLNRDDLGGIGTPIARQHAADSSIITSPAIVPDQGRILVAYQARNATCPDGHGGAGLGAIAVTANSLKPVWCAQLEGRSAPVVTTTDGYSDPIVWAAGARGDDRLHGYRGTDGKVLYDSKEPISGLRRFMTLLVADGRLYVAGDNHVIAFRWNGH